jgi:hypothetical protein
MYRPMARHKDKLNYPYKDGTKYHIIGCLLVIILRSQEGEYQDIAIRECNYPEHEGSNFPRNCTPLPK